MGGRRKSGRWKNYIKRWTVEDCPLMLNVDNLSQEGVLRAGDHYQGTLAWLNARTGEWVASIGYETNMLEINTGWLRLHYSYMPTGVEVDYRIPLTWTLLPSGGRRWWFVCPLTVQDVPCNRRVGRLYLPPNDRYFGCRYCLNLTYDSCQVTGMIASLLGLIWVGLSVSNGCC